MPNHTAQLPDVCIKPYKGKPVIHINGKPYAMPTYSPTGWRKDNFMKTVPWFTEIGMGLYFVSYPRPLNADEWGEQLFWKGDCVQDEPNDEYEFGIDEQISYILERDPDAYFIVRNGGFMPPSWCKLHPDQMFVDCDGNRQKHPSIASKLHWQMVADHGQALIRWCERQPWADRLIGHWYGWEGEGTTHNAMAHRMFDYSDVMKHYYREFLKGKYRDVCELRNAHNNPELTFENVDIPPEKLLGNMEDVRKLKYWQNASDNQPMRDYLLCTTQCYHKFFTKVMKACKDASNGNQIIVTDCMKQTMYGWSNFTFFDPGYDAPLVYDEMLSSSGHIDVADLLELPSFDGIITPHDYQARGVGNIFEPEGIVDSCVLRNKFFFAEGDVRTYNDDKENGSYGTARDINEFKAINWRNFATATTRGFNYYWMDLVGDWFGNKEIQTAIRETVQIQKKCLEIEHKTAPSIAMIIDDKCVLETNGNGVVLNELIMWEQKMGLSHCGVPFRIYLLEDLALDNFPEHRIFYFPNMFRVDSERLALLQEKVMRNGNVVVWGPGSGISNGQTISPDHASELTGFEFDYIDVNHTRRVHITNLNHPITRGLSPDTVYGNCLAYGPLLHPKGGTQLGLAWTKTGRNYSGLEVKSFGRGARSENESLASLGAGDWSSVFTYAGPLPANLWRNLATFSGTHIYSTVNDVVIADQSIVAVHSIQSGQKTLYLPEQCNLTDLVTGEQLGKDITQYQYTMNAPETRLFYLFHDQV